MIAVRFAPSPTGYLHIGGARTAVFNWLFAKKHGGKFFLRIEDTDVQRSGEEMARAILESLRWLGLDWDGEPIYQSKRFHIYKDFSYRLLREGKAYRCFCSPEQIAEARELAVAEKQTFKYDGRCRRLSPAEVESKLAAKAPFAIRFAVQAEGVTSFHDEVLGAVSFDNDAIGDFVILRSDGLPTYHLAVVVDDHEMGITHIIRGHDHISNTPKQVLLYEAFAWSKPVFAHVPLILGPDKTRLSKRHGATAVREYANRGVLPEALFNFLALLGWAPGDDREILSQAELIQLFDLAGIAKSNAVFDEKKLEWMNGQYLSAASIDRIEPLVQEAFLRAGAVTAAELENNREYFRQVIALLKSRVKYISDFVTYGTYFFREPEHYEEAARAKYWKDPQTGERLEKLASELMELKDFTAPTIEETVRQLAEKFNLSAAKLIHPTRLALTGFSVSPSLFETMEVLGQTRVVNRLRKAAKFLKAD